MAEEDVRSAMSAFVTDAISFQTEIGLQREKATDYFHARPFGNEEDGRSQVVSTDVRDTILSTLPPVVKLFFGAERAVEFVPRRADAVEAAAQASDYIQYLFAEENNGFMQTLSVLTDGMLRKMGVFKYGIEEGEVKSYELEDVTQEQLEKLLEDDRFDLISQHQTGTTEPQPQDQQAMAVGVTAAIEPLYSIKCSIKGDDRIFAKALPPEEFIYSRNARSVEEAVFVGHQCQLTKSELLEMGIDEDVIEEHGHVDRSLEQSPEAMARNPNAAVGTDDGGQDATQPMLYIEGYPKLDVDGDGKAELRKICTLGPGHYVVSNDPVDSRPFTPWTPVPEPHSLGGGMSIADLVMDLQLTKSSVLRGILDSLAASLFPRTAFAEGLVNVNDILNTEIGAPIRVKGSPTNAIQSFSHSFTGQQAMPLMEYFKTVGESRTGRDPGTMGIDADSLQSSTADAVGAAVSASQERIELYARIFAEMALKPLFKGLLKLYIQTKPTKRIMRLRGKIVEIDPASWDADMDVTVNIALGTTLVQGKLAGLGNIIAKQEQVLQLLGPSNPICSLAMYSGTLQRATELYGFKDVESFFKTVDPNWAPPQAPEQKSPEQTIAEAQMQIEQMKALKDIEIKHADLEMKKQDSEREHRRKVAMDAADISLRTMEMQYKYHAENAQREFEQGAARDTQMLDGMKMVAEHSLEADRHEHEKELERGQQEHDQQMAERATAAQEEAATAAPTE